MDTRELKGHGIAATTRLRRFDSRSVDRPLSVWSRMPRTVSSRPSWVGEYARADRPDSWPCNCPDFELRQQPCKHILAVGVHQVQPRDHRRG